MYIRFEVNGSGLYVAGPMVLWHVNESWRAGERRPRGVRPASQRTRDRYGELLDELVMELKAPPAAVYDEVEGWRRRTYFRVGEPTAPNIAAGWEMVTILRAHGMKAYEVFAPIPPGEITFLDEKQVVVRERARARSSGRGRGKPRGSGL
ncbi:MAG: hypothetical protein ACOYN0_01015 [Phycisphaerales bacterium]